MKSDFCDCGPESVVSTSRHRKETKTCHVSTFTKGVSKMQTYQPEDLLTRKEAARYLKLSPGTLATWDSTKRHDLHPIKIGYTIRYRRRDLDKFLETCKPIRRS